MVPRRDFLKTASLGVAALASIPPHTSSAITPFHEGMGPRLLDVDEGKVWVDPAGNLRILFSGDENSGFDAVFQVKERQAWQSIAQFPSGRVWAIYNEWDAKIWDPGWFSGEHGFRIYNIRPLGEVLQCTASGSVDGQAWDFEDLYSFESGAIKVARSWRHGATQSQKRITLATALRTIVGSDQRYMFPGIVYNDNPGTYATRQVPHLPKTPFAKGAYEEHRFPVPFVNLESTVDGRRVYASIVSVPSRVPQAHRGDDQWWSLGLQWLWANEADILLLSGPVTTNGMNSMVYGHINGFDSYEDAYIDVDGETEIRKTFYIDVGIASRPGYAFRETLSKALEIFKPYKTQSIPFSKAMDLKFQYAATAYGEWSGDACGFPLVPKDSNAPKEFRRLIYGWVGRNLAVAYSLLKEGDRTGDENLRRMGFNTVRFFATHARQDVPGLLYGDYLIPERRWVGFLGLPDWPESISSRQLGEILDHFAELTVWARQKNNIPDVELWQNLLVKAADFLAEAKRYRGMYPRMWYPNGKPVGWDGAVPIEGSVTASGAYLVAPMVKIHRLSGNLLYLKTAESVLRAYYDAYGRDLKYSYAGASLDAACEDKEAGQGFLHGAITLFEETKKREYLEWAHDAADWLLTWYYVYDVELPSDSPLRSQVNTTGWTTVSVQNQVIDMFGDYSVADLYNLGKYLQDERYQSIARTMFDASTQTIARPGVMFGLPQAGMQFEHLTQTDYAHVRNGRWRGHGYVPEIVWPLGNTLYNGEKLIEIGAVRR